MLERLMMNGMNGGVNKIPVVLGFPDAELQQLLATDAGPSDALGYTVAISSDGNTAVAGAISEGAIYVFLRTNGVWNQSQKIVPAVFGPTGAGLGYSLEISDDGTRIAAGSPYNDTVVSNGGAIYVYDRSGDTFTETDILYSADAASDDRFGWHIGMSADGKVIVGGSVLDDPRGSASGSAYVFELVNGAWTQRAKLVPSDGATGDEFGTAISVSGDGSVVLVGAKNANISGVNDTGAAWIFTRSGDTWPQTAKISPTDIALNDHFGWATAISYDGTLALIASPHDDDKGSGSGSAYMFENVGGTWNQIRKFVASDGLAVDFFGQFVAMSNNGDIVAISAPGDDDAGIASGSVYIYERNKDTGFWAQTQKFHASDRAGSDQYGNALALSGGGNFIIVGASSNNAGANGAGAAYIYGPST